VSRRRSSSSGPSLVWWAAGGLAVALGIAWLMRPDDAPNAGDPFAGLELAGGSGGSIGGSAGAAPAPAPAPIATPDRWPDGTWDTDPAPPPSSDDLGDVQISKPAIDYPITGGSYWDRLRNTTTSDLPIYGTVTR